MINHSLLCEVSEVFVIECVTRRIYFSIKICVKLRVYTLKWSRWWYTWLNLFFKHDEIYSMSKRWWKERFLSKALYNTKTSNIVSHCFSINFIPFIPPFIENLKFACPNKPDSVAQKIALDRQRNNWSASHSCGPAVWFYIKFYRFPAVN